MKNKLLLPLFVLMLFWVVTPRFVKAQENCSDYVLLKDSAQYEILTYNNNDKLESRATYHVKNVNRNNGKVEATIETKIYDKKDKAVSEGEFTVGCENGSVWMDMRSFMNPGMMEAYKDMEVSMEGDKMLYPNNMAVGQELEDGMMTIDIKNSGQSMSTMTMKIVDRKVEGKEKIQVPAGTYDTFKISQNTEMENRAMGMKMPGMRVQTIEYYVPRIGMVRSETYRNGKLMSYSVLSKVSE